MRFFIRADASQVIGSGHVMRSLTLAQALREAGAEVQFIAREHPGHLAALLQSAGFRIELLPWSVDYRAAGGCAHAAWLGAHWEEDARATAATIQRAPTKPDWLIVDHYGIDQRWEAALRASVGRIMVIDDLADRSHDCDLLLDQNLVERIDGRYRGKVPESCGTMLGPRYALLQPEYAELHSQLAPRSGRVRRICIYFGGADRNNLTLLALRAFLSLELTGVEADVVAADAGRVAQLQQCAAGHPQVRVHAQLPTLALLWARADLGVGAAGSTSWERLCLGVPALVVSLAHNQREVAEALSRRGLIGWLGEQDAVGLTELQQALAVHFERGSDLAASRAGLELVDGQGVSRVVAALLADARTPLRLRGAVPLDEALLFEWANDPVTRRNSGGRAVIGAEEHRRWLAARLGDRDGCLLLVAETDAGVPVGTVRFDRAAGDWRVNYSLAGAFRARGLARPMLGVALEALAATRAEPWVTGRVMTTNVPSHKVFAGLGFEVLREQNGYVEYRRALRPDAVRSRGPVCR
jgi:UDP-2,4-diacetamido-2,4,6-trideoxy-beta-L-altropyranose hydrolase